jgi:hypothetical protein
MELWLEARDRVNSQAPRVYKKLTVQVDDENDNMPRFNTTLYRTSLLENQNMPVGTVAMQVCELLLFVIVEFRSCQAKFVSYGWKDSNTRTLMSNW